MDSTVTEAKLVDAWNFCEGTDCTPREGELGFTFAWTAVGVGSGETTFYMGRDGVMHCDNEQMSREFMGQVLARFLDGVKMDQGEE
jgi:hypothetical protein